MSCDGTRPDEIGRRVDRSGKTVRAWLRERWPEQAPGQGGHWYLSHHQVQETIAHFGNTPGPDSSSQGRTASEGTGTVRHTSRRRRENSDEAYVIALVADLVGEEAVNGHRFDWLRGDAGTTLPVDAYFPEHDMVLEYRERQHLAERADTFGLWDRKSTVSGVSRRVQRARYDKLREDLIPQHGILLLVVNADDLAHGPRGRLLRTLEADRATLRRLLKEASHGR